MTATMSDDDFKDSDSEDGFDDEDLAEPGRIRKSDDHHHRLNVFRDLRLFTNVERLDEIAVAIAERLDDPWRRATERDETKASRGLDDWRVFERLAVGERPGALIFLVPNRSKNHLYVSNIVPTKGHSLGVENYNEILVDFADKFVRPVAEGSAIRYELTDDWVDFAGDLGETAFSALVAAANFPNGTHPNDQERWMRFILTARRSALDVDHLLLARWLEAEGFTPRRASDMVEEYDFALRLLDLYDRS
jgi:hypothetical protein